MWRYAVSGAIAIVLLSIVMIVFQASTPLRPASSPPQQRVRDLKGIVTFLTPNSLKVGSQTVLLCGVVPSRAATQTTVIASQAKYEKATVTCQPVGGGTPCDGKSVSKVGKAIVAQCKIVGKNIDLAAALADAGVLCGTVPGYKSC